MGLKRDFNIERLATELADRLENAHDTVRDANSGVMKSLWQTACQGPHILRLGHRLAKALSIPTRHKNEIALLNEIADALIESGSTQGTRIKVEMDWSRQFWADPDVRAAGTGVNPFSLPSRLKTMKSRASQIR